MATSQLVSNSLENKINNDTRDYSIYVDPDKAREFFATSDMLRANQDKYNINPFTPVNESTNYGINNTNSTSYNKGALINPNIGNSTPSYKTPNYNTNNYVSQLKNISDNIGNYNNDLTSKEEYLNNLTSKITQLINSQKESTQELYNTAYQNEIDQLNYAKKQVTKEAKEQQRQIQGTKAQQLLALDQTLARQGLNGAGEAISNRIALDIASEENANKIGLNLQNQLSEYEMQGIIALRNKDNGIKSALAQINSDEANYMLNAYQEAENYNMNLLNYQLNIAQTQADIQSAIDDATYRQAQFEEGIREYNESLAEQIRQYNESLTEQKRQYDTDLAENQRQYDATLLENKRQYDTTLAEQIRQYNEDLAYKKEYSNNNYLEELLSEDETEETTKNNLSNGPLTFTKNGYFLINKK